MRYSEHTIIWILIWVILRNLFSPLQWRHSEHDGVLDHQPHGCLLNLLFRRRSKKISKLRVTGLFEGNTTVTGEFPTQRASNAENVSTWWRHHDYCLLIYIYILWRPACYHDVSIRQMPRDTYLRYIIATLCPSLRMTQKSCEPNNIIGFQLALRDTSQWTYHATWAISLTIHITIGVVVFYKDALFHCVYTGLNNRTISCNFCVFGLIAHNVLKICRTKRPNSSHTVATTM